MREEPRYIDGALERAARMLLWGKLALAVSFSAVLLLPLLFLLLLYDALGSPLALFLVGMMAVAALVPMLEALTYRAFVMKAVRVMDGLRGVSTCKTKGLSLVSTIRPPDESVAPLTLRLSGADEVYVFHLEIPWNLPADLMALAGNRYADLPGIIADVEEIGRSLRRGEDLLTDLDKGVLAADLLPGWGRWRRPNESAEDVRNRILERWRQMDFLRRKALGERRFQPTFVRGSGFSPPGPFLVGFWCANCWKSRFVWSDDKPQCHRCGQPLLEVYTRVLGRVDMREKMDRVRSRYAI